MEKLFTKTDIDIILTEANTNEHLYLGGLYIDGDAKATGITTITERKRLIITEGNEHTGFQHLMDRHCFYSLENYWQSTETGSRLDDPSKFHPQMVPIVDLLKVAEAIFESGNKNITVNHHTDLFDKYTGYYNFTGDKEERYHLLTYKDTAIVHSLFPDKKRYNPKRKLKLAKGVVSSKITFPAGHNDLIVPYENADGLTVYSILWRRDFPEQTERLFIRIHDKNGQPQETAYLVNERKLDGFERFGHEMLYQLQHNDLTDLETIILEIDKYSHADDE